MFLLELSYVERILFPLFLSFCIFFPCCSFSPAHWALLSPSLNLSISISLVSSPFLPLLPPFSLTLIFFLSFTFSSPSSTPTSLPRGLVFPFSLSYFDSLRNEHFTLLRFELVVEMKERWSFE
ncbi:hypothetical protein ACJQWK_03670 [Exserohilum turcicum]